MAIITIFSTNENQGSAVLDAVLANGKYTPRAVSWILDSDGSKVLIAKGVEVVVGNLFDKESVKNAIRGSEAVFGNTNFWDPEVHSADSTGKREITQGKNLVDAAKEVGVKFFIWSSLPSAKERSKGLYNHVYHYDNKAVIEDYLKATGVRTPYCRLAGLPRTCGDWAPSRRPIHATSSPSRNTVPTISSPQRGRLGAAALALLTNYTDASKGVLGKSYPMVSLQVMYIELAEAIAAAIKKQVKFVPVEATGVLDLDEVGNGLRILPHHRGVGSGSGTEPHRLVTVSAPLHEFHATNANSNANTTNNTSASSSTCPATLSAFSVALGYKLLKSCSPYPPVYILYTCRITTFSHPDASPSHETIPRSHRSVPRGAPQRKSAMALLLGRIVGGGGSGGGGDGDGGG
ncbi:NmrA-like family-domain-containing protein [Mycena leptocephala]|nr:NmrA-like family-domain-containing protein [Mycena leptocephala]